LGCHCLRSQRAPDAPMAYIELGPVGPTRILGNSFLNAQPIPAWEDDQGIVALVPHPNETGVINIANNVFSGIGQAINTPAVPRVLVTDNINRDLHGTTTEPLVTLAPSPTPWMSGNRGDRFPPARVPASPTVQQ